MEEGSGPTGLRRDPTAETVREIGAGPCPTRRHGPNFSRSSSRTGRHRRTYGGDHGHREGRSTRGHGHARKRTGRLCARSGSQRAPGPTASPRPRRPPHTVNPPAQAATRRLARAPRRPLPPALPHRPPPTHPHTPGPRRRTTDPTATGRPHTPPQRPRQPRGPPPAISPEEAPPRTERTPPPRAPRHRQSAPTTASARMKGPHPPPRAHMDRRHPPPRPPIWTDRTGNRAPSAGHGQSTPPPTDPRHPAPKSNAPHRHNHPHAEPIPHPTTPPVAGSKSS